MSEGRLGKAPAHRSSFLMQVKNSWGRAHGKGVEILCNLDIDLQFDVWHVSRGEFSHVSAGGSHPTQVLGRAGRQPRPRGIQPLVSAGFAARRPPG